MQNKGAIRLFAILLALACAYYLMFTWVAYGIQEDAEAYAENYVLNPDVIEASKKDGDNTSNQTAYIDSARTSRTNFYLDSIFLRKKLNKDLKNEDKLLYKVIYLKFKRN